jgi:hypothetical protein
VQPRRARDVAGLQDADLLTLLDDVAGRHEWLDRLEARHQAAGVLDREHGAPGDGPGEAHHSGLRGEHGRSRGGGDVDASVSRAIRRLRCVEGARHLVRRDRPGPGGEPEQQQDHEDAHAGHGAPARPAPVRAALDAVESASSRRLAGDVA